MPATRIVFSTDQALSARLAGAFGGSHNEPALWIRRQAPALAALSMAAVTLWASFHHSASPGLLRTAAVGWTVTAWWLLRKAERGFVAVTTDVSTQDRRPTAPTTAIHMASLTNGGGGNGRGQKIAEGSGRPIDLQDPETGRWSTINYVPVSRLTAAQCKMALVSLQRRWFLTGTNTLADQLSLLLPPLILPGFPIYRQRLENGRQQVEGFRVALDDHGDSAGQVRGIIHIDAHQGVLWLPETHPEIGLLQEEEEQPLNRLLALEQSLFIEALDDLLRQDLKDAHFRIEGEAAQAVALVSSLLGDSPRFPGESVEISRDEAERMVHRYRFNMETLHEQSDPTPTAQERRAWAQLASREERIEALLKYRSVRWLFEGLAQLYDLRGDAADIGAGNNLLPARGLLMGGLGRVFLVDRLPNQRPIESPVLIPMEADAFALDKTVMVGKMNVVSSLYGIGWIANPDPRGEEDPHVESYEKLFAILRQMRSLLAPHGRLILIERWDNFSGPHMHDVGIGEFFALAGFRDVEIFHYGSKALIVANLDQRNGLPFVVRKVRQYFIMALGIAGLIVKAHVASQASLLRAA